MANLNQIDRAKSTWALENNIKNDRVPSKSDLFGAEKYIRVVSQCPTTGYYSLNKPSAQAECSLHGNVRVPRMNVHDKPRGYGRRLVGEVLYVFGLVAFSSIAFVLIIPKKSDGPGHRRIRKWLAGLMPMFLFAFLLFANSCRTERVLTVAFWLIIGFSLWSQWLPERWQRLPGRAIGALVVLGYISAHGRELSRLLW